MHGFEYKWARGQGVGLIGRSCCDGRSRTEYLGWSQNNVRLGFKYSNPSACSDVIEDRLSVGGDHVI